MRAPLAMPASSMHPCASSMLAEQAPLNCCAEPLKKATVGGHREAVQGNNGALRTSEPGTVSTALVHGSRCVLLKVTQGHAELAGDLCELPN